MLNRKTLKALAQEMSHLFTVTYNQFGVPVTLNGESLGNKPWLELESRIFRGQFSELRGVQVEVVEECEETPLQSDGITFTTSPVSTKAQLHPLRGYTVTTKNKVVDGLYARCNVNLSRVQDAWTFARVLARHLKADVRVRMIDGVIWLLVSKGSTYKAFSFS